MKRILLLMYVVMSTLCVDAQYRKDQLLYCTGNNVNVRKSPSKNSSLWYAKDSNEHNVKMQLFKGDGLNIGTHPESWFCIKYLGRKQNGFLYVEIGAWDCNQSLGSLYPPEGYINAWVSADYLNPVCTKCYGWGYVEREDYENGIKCPKCHGHGF